MRIPQNHPLTVFVTGRAPLNSPSVFMHKVILVALLSCVHATGRSTPSEFPAPDRIDQRPVLTIGSYSISGYLLDKYYGRFSEAQHQRFHRFPTAEESKSWLDEFTTKQCVIAHARLQGYERQPEVIAAVSRMARNVLTQSDGPFYRQLSSVAAPPDNATAEAIYSVLADLRDVVIAHFPSPEVSSQLLGADFEKCTTDEKIRRITHCGNEANAEVATGSLAWPFMPFCEIADIVSQAPVGVWMEHRISGEGMYHIFVRSSNRGHMRQPAQADPAFKIFLSQIRNLAIQRHRQHALLTSSAFHWEKSSAEMVVAVLSGITSATNEIPAMPVASMGATPLFSYAPSAQPTIVTVEEFRQHFNNGYVRRIPCTLPALRSEMEKMALEEMDYRAAKALKLDEDPQFREDRAGFGAFMVLDAFETQALRPNIKVTQEEIDAYVAGHPEYLATASPAPSNTGRNDALKRMLSQNKLESIEREIAAEIRSSRDFENHIDLARLGQAGGLADQPAS